MRRKRSILIDLEVTWKEYFFTFVHMEKKCWKIVQRILKQKYHETSTYATKLFLHTQKKIHWTY